MERIIAMRVFRIETKTGRGICAAGTGICDDYHQAAKGPHCLGTCFGAVKCEKLAAFRAVLCGWKFAFPSIDAARAWFPEQVGRQAMEDHGAHIVEYEVDDVDIQHDKGDHQVIFDVENATKVAVHSVVTFEVV